jgi:ribonuclease Z
MHRFGPAVQHIFTSSACKQSSFVAATQTSRKLHRVCPSLFAEVQPFLSSAVHIGVAGLPLTPVLATPSMEYRVLPTKRRGLALRDSVSNGSPDHAADESWNSLVRNGGGGEALQETDWLKMQTAKAYIDSAKYAHQMQLRSSLPVDSDASLSDLERDSLADLDLFSEGSAALLAGADNRLTFLGTGCAVPSKYRNVSGILLQLAATDSSMLLDAGEGTWAQLLRVGLSRPDQFGISSSSFDNESGLDEFNHDLEALVSLRIAQQLKVVWISHPHADHHLGLLTVIAERKRLIKGQSSPSFAPLVVVAPPSVLLFLEENALLDGELAGAFLPLSTRQLDPQDLCDTSDLYWPEETNGMAAPSDAGETKAWPYRHRRVAESCRAQMASSLSQTQAVFASMGLRSVLNVQVTHCRQSFGLVLEGGTGVGDAAIFKLVYSGDTRPCNLLTEHGRGATILIHEATFEDDKLHEAVAKRHSTLGEALDVGAAMGAHRVVLTHFSQRYPSMPQIESASTHLDADLQIQPQQQYQRKVSRRGGVNSCNFIVAFDFMHVSFRDLLWAPTVTDVLERVFPPVAIDADEINDVELDEEREVSAGVDTKQKQQSGKKGGREKPPSVTRDCTCCDRNVSDEGSAHIAQMAMECSVHVARAGKRKAEQLNKPPL